MPIVLHTRVPIRQLFRYSGRKGDLPSRLSFLITSRSLAFAANFSRSTTAAEAKRKAASSWLLSSSVMTWLSTVDLRYVPYRADIYFFLFSRVHQVNTQEHRLLGITGHSLTCKLSLQNLGANSAIYTSFFQQLSNAFHTAPDCTKTHSPPFWPDEADDVV